ncbi:hypothetical protein CO657_27615 (plasmid) [Rhizobium acidisoli]|uniref:Uncharacterized protein n=1 Tax=Rhizobium acidisoli TaxID=1538158 RepID=A0AAE6C2Y5_9HYPH|nr:hypothetical protein [Rhizobium acidisoli]QAS81643.1 hypothetical protein CO657_27615 [Rhizobium acidisoli]
MKVKKLISKNHRRAEHEKILMRDVSRKLKPLLKLVSSGGKWIARPSFAACIGHVCELWIFAQRHVIVFHWNDFGEPMAARSGLSGTARKPWISILRSPIRIAR